MDENFECYYNRMPTEDLQKCVDHVIADHGDKVLKLRAIIPNENTGKHEVISKKTLVSYQTIN